MKNTYRSYACLFLLIGVLGCAGKPQTRQSLRAVQLAYRQPALSVCISGDFNQWSRQSHCMRDDQNEWRMTLYLPPGKYRYLFVVDSRQWMCDPNALYEEKDGFGRRNSVLLVE